MTDACTRLKVDVFTYFVQIYILMYKVIDFENQDSLRSSPPPQGDYFAARLFVSSRPGDIRVNAVWCAQCIAYNPAQRIIY